MVSYTVTAVGQAEIGAEEKDVTVVVPFLLWVAKEKEEDVIDVKLREELLVIDAVAGVVLVLLEKEKAEEVEEIEGRDDGEMVPLPLEMGRELKLLVADAMIELLVNGLDGELVGGGMTVVESDVPLVELVGTDVLAVEEAVLFEDGLVPALVVPETMLELLINGLVEVGALLAEGPTVVDDAVLFVEVVLLVTDPLVDEAVLLGNRELLDGALLVGTVPIDEAVVFTNTLLVDTADGDAVPLEGREDVGRLLVDEAVVFANGVLVDALLVGTMRVDDDAVPLEGTEDVGRLPVDEAVLFETPLVEEGPTVDDAEVPLEEDVGRLFVDEAVLFRMGELDAALLVGKMPVDDADVPFRVTDDVGSVVVEEAVLFTKSVEVDTPLVEGPTVDVLLAREELAAIDDDKVPFVTTVLLEEAIEVGVTVPLLEGELVRTLVTVEEAVLLKKGILVEPPLLDGRVALALAELLGVIPEDVATVEDTVPFETEVLGPLLVDAGPLEEATLVPLDSELVDALPVEVMPVDEAVVFVSGVEEAMLGETGLEEAVPFVDETGGVLIATLLLTRVLLVVDEGTNVDVPLVGAAELEGTIEVGGIVLLEAGETPVLVGRVALLGPDVVDASVLAGAELIPLVGALVELPAPPVTVTVTVTVTVVVEVDGVGVTVMVIGVGVIVTVTGVGVTVTV